MKKQKAYGISDIKKILHNECKVIGNQKVTFTNTRPVFDCDTNSLTWIKDLSKYSDWLISTKAKIIICKQKKVTNKAILKNKCLVQVNNPKLAFIRIVQHLFSENIKYGIHVSSVVHPAALIHQNVFIGPFCQIGKVKIGEGTIVSSNVFINDNVIIGKDVKIHAGAIIGESGFGYALNEINEFEKFPHLGGVEIQDFVEIGANTCIDRGTLGNTVIKKGTKINNLVHIAHNAIVGKHCAIHANSYIGGSTVIGDYSWIAPSATIRNGIELGKKSTVGLGAVVTKNIPENDIWVGMPAKSIKKFK